MSKRKTFIELQTKPENKAVRQLFDKTKLVDYAPITLRSSDNKTESAAIKNQEINVEGNSELEIDNGALKAITDESPTATQVAEDIHKNEPPKNEAFDRQRTTDATNKSRKNKPVNFRSNPSPPKQVTYSAQPERLRIFQTSTPVSRTVTKFQKAAIVVRGENGKQVVELSWRDQMNEKTRDIWDFLVIKFEEAEKLNLREISIRKRVILDQSGVKSDRTFISAMYTLEDMGLIEVKRLSGNKEGNIYILTDEGREEVESYGKQTL